MISATQIKMARIITDWSQDDLAKLVSVSMPTIRNIESGKSAKVATLSMIKSTFEAHGVEFTEADGVRRKTQSLRILEGEEGFWEFYNDVYETLSEGANEILVNNVDEKEFDKWFGDAVAKGMEHKKRMNALRQQKDISLKILICEGDYYFTVPEYADYRWTPKERFTGVPSYIYGNKKAEILFEENNVTIFILDNPKIARAHKTVFNVMWDQAIHIPSDKIKTIEGRELDE